MLIITSMFFNLFNFIATSTKEFYDISAQLYIIIIIFLFLYIFNSFNKWYINYIDKWIFESQKVIASEKSRSELSGKQRHNPHGHPSVIQNAYSPVSGELHSLPLALFQAGWYIYRTSTILSSSSPHSIPHNSRHPSSRTDTLSLSARLLPRLSVSIRRGAINKTFVTRRLWLTGTWAPGANGQPHEYLSIDCTSSSFAPDVMRRSGEGWYTQNGRHHEGGWPMRSHASSAVSFPPFLLHVVPRCRREKSVAKG